MAYRIDKDECLQCGECEVSCTRKCIQEKDGDYIIDADKCTECGECIKHCFADAIYTADGRSGYSILLESGEQGQEA